MNSDSWEGLLLYAAAYCFATIGIFAVLAKMNDITFSGFNGLGKKDPLVAGTLSVFLFSFSCIPLTAGFLAKFYMLKAALSVNGSLWLVILAVLMAAVSVSYYFKVLQAMYFKEPDISSDQTVIQAFKQPVFRWSLIVLAVFIILLGLFPGLLLTWYYF